MSDAFLSYSRKDSELVDWLRRQLSSRGIEIWVDTEIPGATKWRQEIADAIDGASCVVLVITRHSVASPEVRREIEHAASSGKPFVPIVHQVVPLGEIPIPVREYQFIALSSKQGADGGLDEIEAAIRQDPDWRREHARVLQRARQWEHGQGDLLHGEDLRRAELWLEQTRKRRADDSRQRALALDPIQLRFVELSAQARAEEERQQRCALSRTIALHNDQVMADAPDLGLLLAVEAWRTEPTIEATAGLLRSLKRVPRLLSYLHADGSAVRALSFSPDGARLVGAQRGNGLEGQRGSILVWDVDQLKLVQIIESEETNALAFSNDGELLAAAGFAGVTLYQCDGTVLRRLRDLPSDDICTIAFRPDTAELAIGTQGGCLGVWDCTNGRRIAMRDRAHEGFVDSVVFTTDGRTLVSAGRDDKIRCWDVEGLEQRAPEISPGGWLVDIAVSPDNKKLAALNGNGVVSVFSLQHGRKLRKGEVNHGQGRVIVFDPTGDRLVTAGGGGSLGGVALVMWNAKSVAPTETLYEGFEQGISALAVAPTRDLVAAGGTEGKVSIWCLGDPRTLSKDIPIAEPIDSLDTSPSTPCLAAGTRSGEVLWLGLDTGELTRVQIVGAEESVSRIEFSPDGSGVVFATTGGGIWLIEAGAHKAKRCSGANHEPVTALAWSADGSCFAAGYDSGALHIWNRADLDCRLAITRALGVDPGGTVRGISALAFDPRVARLAIAGLDHIVFHDTNSGERVGDTPYSGLPPSALRFSPDGEWVVTGAGYQPLLFNAVSGEFLRQCRGRHRDPAVDIDFSKDGSTMATCAADGAIMLWDTATWTSIGPIATGDTPLRQCRFTHDGAAIVSLDWEGRARQWEASARSWANHAARLANRALTASERQTYATG